MDASDQSQWSVVDLELLLHGGVHEGAGVGERGQQLVVDGLQAEVRGVEALVAVVGPVLDVDIWQRRHRRVRRGGACKVDIIDSIV